MTNRLLSLERALAQLARDFARDIVLEALRTRIEDLGPLLDRRTVAPSPVASARPSRAPRSPVPRAKKSPAPKTPPSRGRATTPPAPRRAAPEEVAELDTDGPLANIITDPSFLLDGILAGLSSGREARRDGPREAPPSRDARGGPGLLGAASSPPGNGASSPALRPGERLQRTPGGAVILRRGRA